MKKQKTKIVIDSDVIIHFIKGCQLPMLHTIFPEYEYVILDIVLNDELRKNSKTKAYLDAYLKISNAITEIEWAPDYKMMAEFALLKKKYDLGESACMVYCKFNDDVLASSNVKDIKKYCDDNNIKYFTTMDFLWEAYATELLTEKECDDFIAEVKRKGSKLPVDKITHYK